MPAEPTLVNGYIPLIDFGAYSIDKSEEECDPKEVDTLADQLVKAFSEVGFAYLKNTGVPAEVYTNAKKVGDTFFDLPVEVKEKYSNTENWKLDANSNQRGWLKNNTERLNPGRPKDQKECFNYVAKQKQVLPDDVVPNFTEGFQNLYDTSFKLGQRVLQVIAMGLKLEDKNFFLQFHDNTKSTHIVTTRYLRYPPTKDLVLEEEQMRCGEHSDFGTITLLHQDDIGGLQVLNKAGEYVDATPVPGTLVVNIGDMMERWTSDRLVSTKHRVVPPTTPEKKEKNRRSIAFFVTPNLDAYIECVDGKNKYPPVILKDHLYWRYNTTDVGKNDAS